MSRVGALRVALPRPSVAAVGTQLDSEVVSGCAHHLVDGLLEATDVARQDDRAPLSVLARADEVRLRAVVCSLQSAQLLQLIIGLHLVEQERVTGCDRFRLRGADRRISDVLDLPSIQASTHHLCDESGFPLDRLPHERIEGPLDDIPVQLHLRILVALPEDPALALLDIGGPPRAVNMVQRHGARLHVGSHPHLLRGADEHRDVTRPRRREQLILLPVIAGLVHETDRGRVHTAGDELRAQILIDRVRTVRGRCAVVAEHQLQRTAHRRRLSRLGVDVLAFLSPLPDPVHVLGDDVSLRHAGRVSGEAGELRVDGCFAPVGGDRQHVVRAFLGTLSLRCIGALGEVLEEPHQLTTRRDGVRRREPLPVLTDRDLRDRQVEIVLRLHVRRHMPHAQHLGHVLELGQAGLHLEPTRDVDLDVGRHGRERRRPLVERANARRLQQIRPQIPLRRVRLDDRVRQRCRGRQRADPVAVALTQQPELHVQIGGLLRRVGVHVERRRREQALVHVRLVDEQVVDTGLLERDPRVSGDVRLRFQRLGAARDRLLDPLDARPLESGFLCRLQRLLVGGKLSVDVLVGRRGRERQRLERGLGEHHGVPVVRCSSSDEQTALVFLEIRGARGQDARLWVDLQPLASELLQHVIRDDDGGLIDQPHPLEFHRAHHHLGGLTRADLVEQPDRRLADDPGHRGALVWPRAPALDHAGEGQVVAGLVVVAQHDRVEAPVVLGRQVGGSLRVLPHPLGESLLNLLGLRRRSGGGLRVEHLHCAIAGLHIALDLDRRLVQEGLDQLVCGLLFGAPCLRRQHAVLRTSGDLPGAWQWATHAEAIVAQQLPEELLVCGRVDPHRADARLDLLGEHRCREDRFEGGHVRLVPVGVRLGRGAGGVEPLGDVPRQVLRGRDDPVRVLRVVVHQVAEPVARFGVRDPEQVGDGVELHAAVALHAERDRLGRAVGALPQRPRCDDAAVENRRF